MTSMWALAALWLGLALIACLLSIWLRISTALSEIVVGTIAQLIIGAMIGSAMLGTDESWIKFLSGIGAIVLTFLAGTELDPAVFKIKWKEAATIGFASFLFPFLGCAAAAHYLRRSSSCWRSKLEPRSPACCRSRGCSDHHAVTPCTPPY